MDPSSLKLIQRMSHLYHVIRNARLFVDVARMSILLLFLLSSIKAVVNEIQMPVALVGAPTFGDPGQNTLYVTSTMQNVDFYGPSIGLPSTSPPNGNLFMVRGLPGRGIPQPRPLLYGLN